MRLYGPDALAVVRPTGVYLLDFFCSDIQFYLFMIPYLCFISLLDLDLYVLRDDALISYRPLAGYGLPPPQGEFCRPYFSWSPMSCKLFATC